MPNHANQSFLYKHAPSKHIATTLIRRSYSRRSIDTYSGPTQVEATKKRWKEGLSAFRLSKIGISLKKKVKMLREIKCRKRLESLKRT